MQHVLDALAPVSDGFMGVKQPVTEFWEPDLKQLAVGNLTFPGENRRKHNWDIPIEFSFRLPLYWTKCAAKPRFPPVFPFWESQFPMVSSRFVDVGIHPLVKA